MEGVIREHRASQDTFRRSRRRFGGLKVSEAKSPRELEDGNKRLRAVVAELSLDSRTLKDVVSREW